MGGLCIWHVWERREGFVGEAWRQEATSKTLRQIMRESIQRMLIFACKLKNILYKYNSKNPYEMK